MSESFLISSSQLNQLDDLQTFKTIISSADYFPGLTRDSPTWNQAINDDRYMKLINFIEAFESSKKGKLWSKDNWLAAHDHLSSHCPPLVLMLSCTGPDLVLLEDFLTF